MDWEARHDADCDRMHSALLKHMERQEAAARRGAWLCGAFIAVAVLAAVVTLWPA